MPASAPSRRRVKVVEVGPRDGLQNEKADITAADKIAFIDRLSASGLSVIEVGAFVSPKWVPQMRDTAKVFAGITKRDGVTYTALVPNLAGLERAATAGVREIAVFAAASETFSRKNINRGIEESLEAYAQVCHCALAAGMRVRGYLSTAFGCPYEGPVPTAAVAAVAGRLAEMGCYEVAVSDTIGVAHPGQVPPVLEAVFPRVPSAAIALHFHDTRGMALANVLTAMSMGISTFDASTGGLGGCPYAPGASGNLATDDLIYMLDGLGVDTGVQLEAILDASAFIGARIGHALTSRVAQAAQK
jgi:hydroxymethylglutaryl-CoA lyase